MRHHRRLIKRLSLRAGVRMVFRRVRFVSIFTAESALRWEVRAWAYGHASAVRFGTGVTRREAIANAARTVARFQ